MHRLRSQPRRATERHRLPLLTATQCIDLPPNDAAQGSAACNVDAKISAQGDIWFVTNRAVGVGDELCFDYGPSFDLGFHTPPSAQSSVAVR